MNYRHVYHAGNFADVTKHLVLLCLLEHLRAKDKPFFVLDTHAGRGVYDLRSDEARRSGEAEHGIRRLADAASPPRIVTRFLDLVSGLQSDTSGLDEYPGSPEIVHRRLRSDDRAAFCELQAREARRLRDRYRRDSRVAVHERDGYEALRALLPPHPRRGLALIDPPYESAGEIERLLRALTAGLRRWPEGIFMIWYPIKDAREARHLHRRLGNSGHGPVLTANFMVRPADHASSLNGSGVAIVRPPWRFEQTLDTFWTELPRLLGQGCAAHAETGWLDSPRESGRGSRPVRAEVHGCRASVEARGRTRG